VSLRHVRNVREPGLRLIRFLSKAQSPRRPSSMSLDSHRLHSRRERSSELCVSETLSNVRELGLRLMTRISQFSVCDLRFAASMSHRFPRAPFTRSRSFTLRTASMSLGSRARHYIAKLTVVGQRSERNQTEETAGRGQPISATWWQRDSEHTSTRRFQRVASVGAKQKAATPVKA
jgi:hypothetical protein